MKDFKKAEMKFMSRTTGTVC